MNSAAKSRGESAREGGKGSQKDRGKGADEKHGRDLYPHKQRD